MGQFVRTMLDRGVEEQAIPRRHSIDTSPVTVRDFALQQVKENRALMADCRKDVCLAGEGDHMGLDNKSIGVDVFMAKGLALLPGDAAVGGNVAAGFDEDGSTFGFEAADQPGNRHSQAARNRLQCGQRGRNVPVLNLGEHSNRQVRGCG